MPTEMCDAETTLTEFRKCGNFRLTNGEVTRKKKKHVRVLVAGYTRGLSARI